MDLLEVKTLTGATWEELAEKAGIHVGNLHHIANGNKWIGPENAEGLIRIGVDLNEQVRTYMRLKRAREIERKKREREAAGQTHKLAS